MKMICDESGGWAAVRPSETKTGLEFSGSYRTLDPITEAFKTAKASGTLYGLYWPDAKVIEDSSEGFTVYVPYVKEEST